MIDVEKISPSKYMPSLPLKTIAWLMAFLNLVFALTAIIGGGTKLFFDEVSPEDQLYLVCCVILGFFNIVAGVVLVSGIIVAKENYILLYILLELVNLVTLTIFAVFNTFEYKSLALFGLFLLCLIMWYGLFLMYKFYWEIREYNTVSSGVIEISCNSQPNPMMGLPEKAIESTAV